MLSVVSAYEWMIHFGHSFDSFCIVIAKPVDDMKERDEVVTCSDAAAFHVSIKLSIDR